jgi:hypothetical protein
LPSSVTIPAGAQSAPLDVDALEDTPGSNDPETVTETIQPNPAYVVGSPSSADVAIVEQPSSTVTIAATTADTTEGSGPPGEFTVTRTTPYTGDLAVAYNLSGTAVNGTDYQTLSGTVTIVATTPTISETGGSDGVFTVSRTGPLAAPLTLTYQAGGNGQPDDYQPLSGQVTIPAGQATATIDVTPLDDGESDDGQGPTTLTVGLSGADDGSFNLGQQSSASMTIDEDPPPLVFMASTLLYAAEGGAAAEVIVSRTGPVDGPLTVSYYTSGNAYLGMDYDSLSGSVTIPAGSHDAAIALEDGSQSDQYNPSGEVVDLSLTADGQDYGVGNSSLAQVLILESPLPTVTIAATADASESGADGEFSVTRTGPTDQPLTVTYDLNNSTAVPGTDYQALSGTVTIPAGARAAPIEVSPLPDGGDHCRDDADDH